MPKNNRKILDEFEIIRWKNHVKRAIINKIGTKNHDKMNLWYSMAIWGKGIGRR